MAGLRNNNHPVSLRKGRVAVLFTCVGRRVSLLRSFADAAKQLKIKLLLCGTDVTRLSAALRLCDRRFLVKPITHPAYLKQLLSIVKANKVRLLVPTIDTDLLLLSRNKTKFAQLGCRVLVSDPDVVKICQDKRKTYKFLVKHGFDSPETISPRTALSRKGFVFPRILKPWDGAAGKGVTLVNNKQELRFFTRRINNCVVQEFVEGTEYTCDVFVDFSMKIRCVVPRRRIEIRSGEVSKGQVVKNKKIMNRAAELAGVLGAGPGVITMQCFLQKNGKIKFTEINPRLGGGVPLAVKAGANFPKWILQQLLGQNPRIKFDGFKDGPIMLRYDDEVWLK